MRDAGATDRCRARRRRRAAVLVGYVDGRLHRVSRRRVGSARRRRRRACSRSSVSRASRAASRGSRSCANGRASGSAFAGFDPEKVARFGDRDIDAPARRRRTSCVTGARSKRRSRTRGPRSTCRTHTAHWRALLWSYEPPRRSVPRALGDIPSTTPESVALAKELKSYGFRFRRTDHRRTRRCRRWGS